VTARAKEYVSFDMVAGSLLMKRTVDVQAVVADNLLDLAALLEVSESLAGEAAVDLETIDEGGDGDQAVGLDILVELLSDSLVEDNSVLGLVLNYKSKKTKLVQRSCDIRS
jgi:hypothetical protein